MTKFQIHDGHLAKNQEYSFRVSKFECSLEFVVRIWKREPHNQNFRILGEEQFHEEADDDADEGSVLQNIENNDRWGHQYKVCTTGVSFFL